MEEIWKDVVGYEGLYQVSNLGRVKSLARRRLMISQGNTVFGAVHERILKFGASLGYQCVTLSKNGVHERIRVHKLVAKHFIPNPEKKEQINHIDGNKHNNCANNLEWCTASENQRHAVDSGLRDNAIQKRRIYFYQFDKEGNFVHRWHGYKEAEETVGVPRQSIAECVNRKGGSAYGYLWVKEADLTNEQKKKIGAGYSGDDTKKFDTPKRRKQVVSIRQYNNDGELVGQYSGYSAVSLVKGLNGNSLRAQYCKSRGECRYMGYRWAVEYD